MEQNEPRVIEHGMTRRDLMRRGTVVGGLVWAAPVLQSFASPAFGEVLSPVPGDCPGRMTGGGKLEFGNDPRGVTYGLGQIKCDGSGPTTIEVNWDGTANQFHATALLSVTCSDQAGVDPERPFACFDTITGTATGTLKLGGAEQEGTLEFTFVDAGEPGIGNDTADIVVRDKDGNIVLDVDGVIIGGNLQAHSSNDADCSDC